MMVFGLWYQIKGLSLPGAALIVVGTIIGPLVNLSRARFSEVSARVDELERKLAAAPRA